jgi:hypothetical protein
MKLAPIALFTYNRLEHTQRTVDALKGNELAKCSDLFVFVDGAKEASDAVAVNKVRQFVRSIEGFQSVKTIERECNLGLSESVTAGVTQLCDEYGRVIAVEDDIQTAPDFLTFMNRGLERYEGEPRVFSVTGHNFPLEAPASYSYDAYFSYRSCSWGWGTWKDRWEKVDWSVTDFEQFIADARQRERFDLGGQDLTWMLSMMMAGKLHGSWDVVWGYTHSKHDAMALRAVVSKVYNTGFDGSGTHCSRASFSQTALSLENNLEYRFPEVVAFDPYFAAGIQRLHRTSMSGKLVRFLLGLKLGTSRPKSARIPQAKAWPSTRVR